QLGHGVRNSFNGEVVPVIYGEQEARSSASECAEKRRTTVPTSTGSLAILPDLRPQRRACSARPVARPAAVCRRRAEVRFRSNGFASPAFAGFAFFGLNCSPVFLFRDRPAASWVC